MLRAILPAMIFRVAAVLRSSQLRLRDNMRKGKNNPYKPIAQTKKNVNSSRIHAPS
jgi:hypothetical protein